MFSGGCPTSGAAWEGLFSSCLFAGAQYSVPLSASEGPRERLHEM